jgi:hypothetical protein
MPKPKTDRKALQEKIDQLEDQVVMLEYMVDELHAKLDTQPAVFICLSRVSPDDI